MMQINSSQVVAAEPVSYDEINQDKNVEKKTEML